MTRNELRAEVAKAINNVERKWIGPSPQHYKYAEAAISTILAALQEPTEEMCRAGRNETIGVGHFYASDIWQAMLNASPLGEQSE